MSSIVLCAHCRARLRLPESQLGKNLKCPRCGQTFQADLADAVESVAPRTAGLVRKAEHASATREPVIWRHVAPIREDEEERSEPRPATSSGYRHLVIGMSVGVGALAFVLVLLTVVLLATRKDTAPSDAPEVAQNGRPEEERKPEPKAPELVAQQKPPETPNAAAPGWGQGGLPPVMPNPLMEGQKPGAAPIAPGAKVTVRAEIQGAPPDFAGDYSRQVIQNLEISLRQMGYEPVAEGGMVLLVRAQVTNTGQNITVRPIGPRPPPMMQPRRPGMQRPANPNQIQTYPLEQITATVVLSDDKGAAVWQNQGKFSSHIRIFRSDNPPREMQQQMWTAFDAWTRGAALAGLRNMP